MTNIRISVCGAAAQTRKTGFLTTGMVGIPVSFDFDAAWDGLAVTAVFRAGEVVKDVALDAGATVCTVPHEVLAEPNCTLMIGAEGRRTDGTLVIPTVWARVGTVFQGAQATGNPALAPTPSQYDRIMENIDRINETLQEQDINRDAVRYGAAQELTNAQKAQARANIGAAGAGEISAALAGITIPECTEYPVWLCDSSTDEYQTAIGQNKATCSLSYADFLTNYFDCYITDHNDRYSVTKKSLGRDSANQYDIYEYTFTPKRYSRTVMLSGGMNACELPAEFGIAYFIKNVMEKTDDAFTWLHDNVRFKIIPVICPWSFDQSPMVYENSNGVNLNKNFDYNHCWESYSAGGAGTKGEAPCSEAETKMLLRWINANAHNCDLWIDCHTDSTGIAEDATAYLHAVIGSDSATTGLISAAQAKITQAYIAAGYFGSGAEKTGIGAWTEQGTNYPKTLYARHICGIPSIMIEQYVGNPYYGGTKTIANTSADINNYVTMLRAYVLAILKREAISITGEDFAWYIYQSMIENHFIADDTEAGSTVEPDEPDDPVEPDEPDIPLFSHGGLNGNGTLGAQTYRAHTELIEVPESGVFTVTNMGGYAVVDLGVYEADGTTFRELTTYYTKTDSGNDWVFTMDRFSAFYPTGKYVRFSIKRTDEPYGTIDLAALANSRLVY